MRSGHIQPVSYTHLDPVDPALLQQALDAALEAAPYYRVRLVWEKRRAFLEPNSEPCLVYPDSVMREMPEQTNGYFFALHCAQNTVYFDWFHFIALSGYTRQGSEFGSRKARRLSHTSPTR